MQSLQQDYDGVCSPPPRKPVWLELVVSKGENDRKDLRGRKRPPCMRCTNTVLLISGGERF